MREPRRRCRAAAPEATAFGTRGAQPYLSRKSASARCASRARRRQAAALGTLPSLAHFRLRPISLEKSVHGSVTDGPRSASRFGDAQGGPGVFLCQLCRTRGSDESQVGVVGRSSEADPAVRCVCRRLGSPWPTAASGGGSAGPRVGRQRLDGCRPWMGACAARARLRRPGAPPAAVSEGPWPLAYLRGLFRSRLAHDVQPGGRCGGSLAAADLLALLARSRCSRTLLCTAPAQAWANELDRGTDYRPATPKDAGVLSHLAAAHVRARLGARSQGCFHRPARTPAP